MIIAELLLLKVYPFTSTCMGYTFKVSSSTIFIFASLFHGGQLIKERICSSGSKFFPLKVAPFLEGLCHPGKENRK